YDESLRKFRDTIVVMEGARLSGVEQGRAEGMAEEQRRIARGLLGVGTPVCTIAKVTGLSEDEISGL
ncbi:MAG: hypothetical protein K2L56_11260, partial [Prevotella sp.]|nr:hypothetical protein [Prevotella sp.]